MKTFSFVAISICMCVQAHAQHYFQKKITYLEMQKTLIDSAVSQSLQLMEQSSRIMMSKNMNVSEEEKEANVAIFTEASQKLEKEYGAYLERSVKICRNMIHRLEKKNHPGRKALRQMESVHTYIEDFTGWADAFQKMIDIRLITINREAEGRNVRQL